MILRLLAVVFFVGWTSAAAAADLGAAYAAYNRSDYRTAHQQFGELAGQGDAQAQYMLGTMFADGKGSLQDFVMAHKWLNLAASQGHSQASAARDRVAERMTADQLAEAQRLARRWQPSASAAEPQTRTESETTDASAAPAPSADAPLNRAEIKAVQTRLNRLGYSAGTPDGVPGGRTRRAIRRYQVDHGLAVDGRPTRGLLEHLTPADDAASPDESVAELDLGLDEVDAAGQAEPPVELIAGIQRLIVETEQRGTSAWVVERLRALVRPYTADRREPVFSDDFSDGDYTRAPAWQVAAGRFWVEYDRGLRTSVTVRPSAQQGQQTSGEELSSAILGALLQSATGGSGGSASSGEAEIHLPRRIGNAFAMNVTLASRETAGGRLAFGFYQGADRASGYRLVYLPGGDSALELERRTPYGSAAVEVLRRPLDLDDGRRHVLRWERDGDGRMTVRVDGELLLEATDRRFTDPFDGFHIVNYGGDYLIPTVTVEAPDDTAS